MMKNIFILFLIFTSPLALGVSDEEQKALDEFFKPLNENPENEANQEDNQQKANQEDNQAPAAHGVWEPRDNEGEVWGLWDLPDTETQQELPNKEESSTAPHEDLPPFQALENPAVESAQEPESLNIADSLSLQQKQELFEELEHKKTWLLFLGAYVKTNKALGLSHLDSNTQRRVTIPITGVGAAFITHYLYKTTQLLPPSPKKIAQTKEKISSAKTEYKEKLDQLKTDKTQNRAALKQEKNVLKHDLKQAKKKGFFYNLGNGVKGVSKWAAFPLVYTLIAGNTLLIVFERESDIYRLHEKFTKDVKILSDVLGLPEDM